ncbi:flagellar basal-body MS-ring/collar protein FliF [Sphingomonas sp. S1-29]|uniref:flagellar basal-body MS-ring/collar protein FliF n=1 Tax=Sphingomonas sp. S1-29 TaxID=2991074 RepID=UPI002240AB54|nr:flagellar basal-body MS-ring/collar protein FliF [Sphingomonas sp. S1-29]UZK68885.1 flagellar basal-body MS-ring/collar protein FliF [Sphingomonas sp. S1-29]
MENALTPLAPARLAAPLAQAKGFFAQPAVRKALPLVLMIGLIASAALAWLMLATPPQRVLFTQLADNDKSAVSDALAAASIPTRFDQSGALTVGEDDYHKARMLLAGQDLPKAAPGGYAILDELPMGVSRAVEGERLRQARESELARSIGEIDAVADARVHLAMPESSVFVRDNAQPSASVIVRLEPGRTLSDAQVRSIVNLVASSVGGMKPDSVTIVDQMGALLSRDDDERGTSVGDARIDYQRRVEDKFRLQLNKLLTPLVGAGNFSAEVQADVDLDEAQATRERYDKEGVIRAEQGNWVGPNGTPGAPGGIPGALSNTPPAAASLTNPNDPATQPGAAVTTAPAKASEEFARTYDLGKEVSVTRTAPGGIKRLSVAVLLRDPEGKARTPAEIRQITDLVRAAVGYNAQRADQVTVVSRAFSPAVTDAEQPAWYDAAWVPMVARNATALIIALLVLFVGVRPLVKSMGKKREEVTATDRAALPLPGADGEAAPEQPTERAPVSIDMLQNARGYDDRVGMVRGFTRDNPARAALAVRDMIKADAS